MLLTKLGRMRLGRKFLGTLVLVFTVIGCSRDTSALEQLSAENATLKKDHEALEKKVAALEQTKSAPSSPGKQEELLARVRQLEEAVKLLQQQPKNLRPADSANPLVGSWAVTAKDRFNATFTDLSFKGDGTCQYVFGGGAFGTAKYQVIGKKLIISGLPPILANRERNEQYLIDSLTEKEVMLDKYLYTRVK